MEAPELSSRAIQCPRCSEPLKLRESRRRGLALTRLYFCPDCGRFWISNLVIELRETRKRYVPQIAS